MPTSSARLGMKIRQLSCRRARFVAIKCSPQQTNPATTSYPTPAAVLSMHHCHLTRWTIDGAMWQQLYRCSGAEAGEGKFWQAHSACHWQLTRWWEGCSDIHAAGCYRSQPAIQVTRLFLAGGCCDLEIARSLQSSHLSVAFTNPFLFFNSCHHHTTQLYQQ